MNKSILSALIGLAGVGMGVIVSAVVNFQLKSKETRLRLLEKIFERKIAAYEQMIEIVTDLRTMTSANEVDENGNLVSYPSCLNSKNEFETFYNETALKFHKASYWLEIEIIREMNFVIDYLIQINITLDSNPDNSIKQIRQIAKQDFIEQTSNLEKHIANFFKRDIFTLKQNKDIKWHKYEKEETIRRLDNTFLAKSNTNIDRP